MRNRLGSGQWGGGGLGTLPSEKPGTYLSAPETVGLLGSGLRPGRRGD
jgi:hypothetical protein